MTRFLLAHRHEPADCRFTYAAWRGFDSPLRRRPALSSCRSGGHQLWWVVEAACTAEALAQLPPYLARRSDATEVEHVPIP
ncbi:hypothetical protein H7X46_09080 [Pseudonocardia sp. C8]|uniref:hypothetical protein n=1 Tax=Pseudonocardia sp. C8 TaxID=2762759 RepID=UPI0016433D47|nr:hypothetical protein [Pseudonocardia sp. C8]MBC3191211.1 hypothetical protein [Pseudonocardia sp. C8]